MISKLQFVRKITSGVGSFVRLIWHSKKLRWSKTGFIKPVFTAPPFYINLHWQEKKRKVYLRTYDGDIDIFYEIFWKEIYALPGMKNRNINSIVDCGANVGLSALYLLREFPRARVICVEPDHENCILLQKNFADEIASGVVSVEEAAVMDKSGTINFTSAAMKYNSKVADDDAGDKIRAMSMQDIFDKYFLTHIDLLKIDVEESEKFIFSGDTDWLNLVDNVLIECHSAKDYEICMRAFQRHRFSVKSIHADPANQNLFWASRITFVPPAI